MRKPKDFDSELQALEQKTKSLKERKLRQLGELVTATGADALDAETLAGALLAMIDADDPAKKESWHARGQAFFQRRSRAAASRNDRNRESGSAVVSGATSA